MTIFQHLLYHFSKQTRLKYINKSSITITNPMKVSTSLGKCTLHICHIAFSLFHHPSLFFTRIFINSIDYRKIVRMSYLHQTLNTLHGDPSLNQPIDDPWESIEWHNKHVEKGYCCKYTSRFERIACKDKKTFQKERCWNNTDILNSCWR